jgi:anti-sigma regulatory factor (Ser/Thr protein kinase)
MSRIALAPVTQWITDAAIEHGDTLPAHLMARLGISRRRAVLTLGKLVAAQWLVFEGTPRHPIYKPGALRQVVRRYALGNLQEDLPWRRDFADCFELRPEVRRMAQHAFTELLNNAIDHSGGAHVVVSMRQTPVQLQMLVSDDGKGLFKCIEQNFDIEDPTLAMLELSKGKLTSAPDRHRGHGLFFTSRLADVFDIHANDAAFQCRGWDRRQWHASRPAARTGTSVYVAIALDTTRTLDGLLRAHSASTEAAYRFERTSVPLHLIGMGSQGDLALASRADAKRVVSRLGEFVTAELDFNGISDIGYAFADELFRVFPSHNPSVRLMPVGMGPQVAAMVASVV